MRFRGVVVQQHEGSWFPERKKVKSLSRVRLFATQWTIAYQSPQSMDFSRQEYWSGSPFPSPGDFPNPGIEPGSPTLQADALLSETRDQTHVPCIGRQVLNHCATRKVPAHDFKLYSFETKPVWI